MVVSGYSLTRSRRQPSLILVTECRAAASPVTREALAGDLEAATWAIKALPLSPPPPPVFCCNKTLGQQNK